ncbi:MAG: DUF433 domain-containing protein [Bryobacteraceae bacterium]
MGLVAISVETDPDKAGGKPIVKGTRIPPEVILIDEDYGRTPEQTHASFPTLPIQAVRAFARSKDSSFSAYLGWAGLRNRWPIIEPHRAE